MAMLGLRARVSGGRAFTMALDQEHYLVSADASWRWRRGARAASVQFNGAGNDDREDSLRWFEVGPRSRRAAMDVEVVETGRADSPRRNPRPKVDYEALALKRRPEQERELASLSAQLEEGRLLPTPAAPPTPRPDVGFRITVDGQTLGTIGMGGHGSLTVTVYVGRQPGERIGPVLAVHGGEHLGEDTFRWREWFGRPTPLGVGQHVRIELVDPRTADLGRVREFVTYRPKTLEEVRARLAELKGEMRPEWWAKKAARQAKYQRSRPPARSYPRGTLLAQGP
jgi:hypothetical protein